MYYIYIYIHIESRTHTYTYIYIYTHYTIYSIASLHPTGVLHGWDLACDLHLWNTCETLEFRSLKFSCCMVLPTLPTHEWSGSIFFFCPGFVEEDSSILGWHDRYGQYRHGREFCTVHSGHFVLLCQVCFTLGCKTIFSIMQLLVQCGNGVLHSSLWHIKKIWSIWKGGVFLLTEVQGQCKSDRQGNVIVRFFHQEYLKDGPLVDINRVITPINGLTHGIA